MELTCGREIYYHYSKNKVQEMKPSERHVGRFKSSMVQGTSVFVPGQTKYVIVEHRLAFKRLYWRGNRAQTRTEQTLYRRAS